jgi:hypothetical protein
VNRAHAVIVVQPHCEVERFGVVSERFIIAALHKADKAKLKP